MRDLRSYEALFDEAEAAVKGDELLIARVRRARLGIDVLAIQRRERLIWHGANGEKGDDGGLDYSAIVSRVKNDWHKWAERYAGRHSFMKYLDSVVSAYEPKPGASV